MSNAGLLARFPVILMAAAVLAGCAATGGIQPQSRAIELASLDTGGSIAPAGAVAVTGAAGLWPDSQWWRMFGDPQLDQRVEQALAGSPSLRTAQARVRGAQAAAGVPRSGTLPSAKIDGEFDRYHFTEHEFVPPPYAGNDYWDNKVLLEVGYDLDLWGKQRSTLSAALDTVHAAEAESQAARLSLQTAVVRTYLGLALDYSLMDVAQSTLDQQQQILDITRRRYAAGLGTHLEVAQAETPLPSTRAEIEHFQELIDAAGRELAALAGQGPGAGEQVRRPTLDLTHVLTVPESVPAHWVGLRPDVVAARWRVEGASKNIEAAKAAFYPDVNINAFAGVQSLSFGDLLTGDSFLSNFGPAVTLPVFTGGKLRAQLGASAAGYDVAVENYNATLVTALEQVADQIAAIRSLDRQLLESGQAVASAQKAYDLALTGYRAGLIEYLSVLNTQSRVLDTQSRLQQLRERRLDAQARLVDALGGAGAPASNPESK